MLDFSILTDNIDLYMKGFVNTIKISIIGLVASFILGNLIAVFRLAPVKLLNFIGAVYVEVIRNIPLILTGFFFYNGLSYFHINLSGFIAGTMRSPFTPPLLLRKPYVPAFNRWTKVSLKPHGQLV